ncbi:MAG: DMT family protein, partial [Tidjanibacter sp.]|nr:DMT family protein [Tidjanibacter sp.]
MKGLVTIGMLVLSNVFMTFAWYGNLKLRDMNGGKDP